LSFLDEAIENFQKSVSLDRRSQKALNGLALCYQEAGRSNDAEQVMRELVQINPNNAAALNNLGVLLNKKDDYRAAIGFFDRALGVNSTMASAFVNRGKARRHLGDLDGAIIDGRKGVDQLPENVDALYQLATSFRAARLIDASTDAFKKALSLAPSRADIHGDFARMIWEHGGGASAFDVLETAIGLTDDVGLMLQRSEFALYTGDLDLAARYASKVQTFGGDYSQAKALMLVARIACERQDEETALLSARKAVSLNPDDFASLHMCCEIEMAFGLFADVAERLTGDAPASHLQRHIALRCTALRGIGDQSYRKWFDYSRFVSETTIETPAGYPTLDAFNRDLGIAIATLHQGSAHPIDQPLFGGAQSFGTLWQQPEQIFQDFAEVMRGLCRLMLRHYPMMILIHS